MTRCGCTLLAVALLAGLATSPGTAAPTPVQQDPLGPIADVTATWTQYQPAESFCVALDGFDLYRALTADAGPACGDGTFHVTVGAPPLCPGCRRLFLDYSAIAANDLASGLFYAHGHVYFRLHAFNPSYTSDPTAHSPNIKDTTNDKLVSPYGSASEQAFTAIETYGMDFVGDTARNHHNEIQGPYYIGPAYVNRAGVVVRGAYVDVDVAGAQDLRNPALNTINYWAGFDAGERTCLNNGSAAYADGDAFYGGCALHPGMSSSGVDPFGAP